MIGLGADALPIILAAQSLPAPLPVLAFYETTKNKNVEHRTFLCARCVLEGYAAQKELCLVTDPDRLRDEGRPEYCDSCACVLHPDDPEYDATEIGL